MIELIDQYTHELEVGTMAKSMADVLREQGIEQGKEQGETQAKQEVVLKLMQIRFNDVPEDVSKKIASIRSISSLDLIIEEVVTAETLDEIDWQNYND